LLVDVHLYRVPEIADVGFLPILSDGTLEQDWFVAQYPTPVVQVAGLDPSVPQPIPEVPLKPAL
jgi:hypothetical protein